MRRRRVVVDLRALQTRAAGSDEDTTVARIRSLVSGGVCDVFVALDGRLPERLMELRSVLEDVLPPEAVVVCEAPTPEQGPTETRDWRRSAGEAIAEACLSGLDPDALWDVAGGVAIVWDETLSAEAASILGLAEDRIEVAAVPDDGNERVSADRPRLAYVSPLPPVRSGIADYSAELLPALSEYYDIDVVVDQVRVDDQWISENLEIRSVKWFEQHARDYERIVYQFGNSRYHQHMFGLLAAHPGVVVLHEVFLAHAIAECEGGALPVGAFRRALHSSHGYGALVDEAANGREAALWKYPCSREVIDRAEGIVVHSRFAQDQMRAWYGDRYLSDCRQVPLCRAVPSVGLRDRESARRRLGIGADDFVVCSFGVVGPTKLSHLLLEAWAESSLASDRGSRLYLVGDAGAGGYAEDLRRRSTDARLEGRAAITGFASRDAYRDYLAAADLAVQLRADSRGETSAAVLDCLALGLPTLVNQHGWAAELPEDAAVAVLGEVTSADLATRLEALRANREALVRVGRRGAEFVREHHDPRRAARLSQEAIESFATRSAGARYRRLLRQLTRLDTPVVPARSDLVDAAQSIAANRRRRGLSQLLLDVSALAHADLKTGVERVARAVLKQLVERPPAGYRVELVRETNGRYVYAREAAQRLLGLEQGMFRDAPLDTAPGDIFLGLDLAQRSVHVAREQLVDLRRRGVAIHFVVYDLLPALRPDCFPDPVPATYRDWLQVITTNADGLVCISRTVADELVEWLRSHEVVRAQPLRIGYFHLGADLAASLPTAGIGAEGSAVLESVRSRPTFLMVGTVEPRKGHTLALQGVEALWERGVDVGLVVVGKEGWDSRNVTKRLRTHPERGRRLHWVERASDEFLLRLYETCAALLAASEGEGFGLPLVEAAQHGLPVVARDIPVFREVGGDHAYYFSGETPAALADALSRWLVLRQSGGVPSSGDMPWLTWAESTDRLIASVIGGDWHTSWPEPGRS